ncbi:MAG: succinate--CoA ligase subunit alpha [Thermoplasmata archaeon]
MSILIDERTKVIIQGITGHQGTFHAKAMLDYGTEVVGGVTPGKRGESVHGIPVFDSVDEAVKSTDADTSMLLVPAPFALEASFEAIDAGIRLLVMITERIPFHDAIKIVAHARQEGTRVIGPNCPGIMSPEKCKVGIMPATIFRRGTVGVVSRSGTLTYEIVNAMTESGLGQSTCVGIGGDPIIGSSIVEILEMFEHDDETESIVIVGEIGGTAEETAAESIKRMEKRVFAYIAGRTAPAGKRMGHAGAIITRGKGTAESKIAALSEAGVAVAEFPAEVADLVRRGD